MVKPNSLIFIGIVSLWSHVHIWCEVGVPKQQTNALNDVTGVQIECLTTDDDLRELGFGLSWKTPINDMVELL